MPLVGTVWFPSIVLCRSIATMIQNGSNIIKIIFSIVFITTTLSIVVGYFMRMKNQVIMCLCRDSHLETVAPNGAIF